MSFPARAFLHPRRKPFVASASSILAVISLLAVLLVSFAPTTSATHIVCRPPECMPVSAFPDMERIAGAIDLERFDVKVDIVEAVAHTRLLMQVRNPSADGTTAFVRVPMPSGGVLTAFNLTSPAGAAHGRVIDLSDSYSFDVGTGLQVDLAQVSERILEFRIDFAAGERWTLEASYAELVPLHHQARVYRFPLDGLGSEPPAHLDVEITGHSRHGVKDVSFPGLVMGTTEMEAQDFTGEAHLVSDPPEGDAIAVWSEGPGNWLASMLCAERPDGGWAEGLFLLQARATTVIARDVVFVIDHSGSMAGGKMEAARTALAGALGRLSPEDRYEVVEFDHNVGGYYGQMADVKPERVAGDQERLLELEPAGFTNIDGGLQWALEALGSGPSDRAAEVVLLTDGFPTAGVTDEKQIAQRFFDANERDAVLHVVAIGLDADQTFLEDIAVASGGDLEVIRLRDGQVQERIAAYLDRLTAPVAKGLHVGVRGFQHSDDLEGPFPTLYEDSTMAISFGDNWTGQAATWQVRAKTAAGQANREFGFPRDACQVVPVAGILGARTHLESLLAIERINGTSFDLQQQIRRLAEGHNLASPYTGWVLVAGTSEQAQSSSGSSSGTSVLVATPDSTSEGPAGDGDSAQEGAKKASKRVPSVGGGLPVALVLLGGALGRPRPARVPPVRT